MSAFKSVAILDMFKDACLLQHFCLSYRLKFSEALVQQHSDEFCGMMFNLCMWDDVQPVQSRGGSVAEWLVCWTQVQ